MNRNLKRAIEVLYKLCAPSGESGCPVQGMRVEQEILKREFINYIAYLSSSDGRILQLETNFLSTYFEYYTTPAELSKYIESNNIEDKNAKEY